MVINLNKLSLYNYIKIQSYEMNKNMNASKYTPNFSINFSNSD